MEPVLETYDEGMNTNVHIDSEEAFTDVVENIEPPIAVTVTVPLANAS
jgi:hypothetical protein